MAGGAAPKSDRIPSLVCALRKKLAAHGVAIETKRGKGYRLSAEMAARLAAIGASPALAAGRNLPALRLTPEPSAAIVAPAADRLPLTFMQSGGLWLRERLADLARRYSFAGAFPAFAGRRSPEPAAIEFARRRDRVFEMRR